MKALIKIEDDPTDQNDLLIKVSVVGQDVISILGGPAATVIPFDYIDTETPAQRKSRAIALLNQWRISMGLPVPSKTIYFSAIS